MSFLLYIRNMDFFYIYFIFKILRGVSIKSLQRNKIVQNREVMDIKERLWSVL